jgi:hypothetical protein
VVAQTISAQRQPSSPATTTSITPEVSLPANFSSKSKSARSHCRRRIRRAHPGVVLPASAPRRNPFTRENLAKALAVSSVTQEEWARLETTCQEGADRWNAHVLAANNATRCEELWQQAAESRAQEALAIESQRQPDLQLEAERRALDIEAELALSARSPPQPASIPTPPPKKRPVLVFPLPRQ